MKGRSFALQSNNLKLVGDRAPSEIGLYYGVGENEGRTMFAYTLFAVNSEGGVEKLPIVKWMIDKSALDIFQVVGSAEKGEVIGRKWAGGVVSKRKGVTGRSSWQVLLNSDTALGVPLVIETDDAKLIITNGYDAETGIGNMTVYGEKTLEDGQVIVWKDGLR